MSVKERITVTVDSEVVAQIRKLAGSTSSFVEAAIREKLDRHRHARAMLDRDLSQARAADPEGFADAKSRVADLMDRHFGGAA
ncbi:type II toxin-antitoxin system CcdA family antitoxin [Actinomadura sp. DC4]|uniref:type II toxin-antitoxin system CcdA family antitoxin n=1 Tax=Actinomadura sp. DC4 TaxID=3055069 RepID=UPI0025B25A08|nr:type II toxin-antitoxin system CcdA family antitoxin [Actinomadura sp. DC4]MDN3354564.1 type II toxin-antitoxin system CcdA family antitoxin [Actinomadura sp. DC4]